MFFYQEEDKENPCKCSGKCLSLFRKKYFSPVSLCFYDEVLFYTNDIN